MSESTTYTPTNISAFGWCGFIQSGTLAAGLTLAKGTVLGITTATGLLAAYNDSLSTGVQTAVGILMEAVDTSSTGTNEATPVPFCSAFGAFLTASLTGMDANGLADLGGRVLVVGGISYTFITGAAYTLSGLATLAGSLAVGTNLAVTGTLTQTGAASFAALATLAGGLKMAETTGTDTAYTVLVTDNVVRCADFTAGRTYALPAAATYGVGRFLIVKAPSNAATYNLILDGNASETIDGATTKTISTNYATTILQAITGGWSVISGS